VTFITYSAGFLQSFMKIKEKYQDTDISHNFFMPCVLSDVD